MKWYLLALTCILIAAKLVVSLMAVLTLTSKVVLVSVATLLITRVKTPRTYEIKNPPLTKHLMWNEDHDYDRF